MQEGMCSKVKATIFFLALSLVAAITLFSLDPYMQTRTANNGTWNLSVDQASATIGAATLDSSAGSVLISGWQEHVGHSFIRYALIRENKSGQSTVIGMFAIQGDVPQKGSWFQQRLMIPQNGKNQTYRLEIYNFGGSLSSGGVRMTPLKNHTPDSS